MSSPRRLDWMWLATLGAVVVGACRSTREPEIKVVADPDPRVVVDATPPSAPSAPSGPGAPGAPASAAWWRDAVGYEIFVRSFQDSDGNGVGDLRGLQQRLDHLVSLGVDLVWLMPIHPSPSYHGYDVTDYRAVNPDYGTMADLDALVAAAKERGIRIIIDMVLNHSSDRHPWFLESRKGGADNAKADWYVWRDVKPEGWARPWDGANVWHELGGRFYYGLFWSGMPDLNLANPAVQREMEDTMVFWVGHGLAGFRIDAIRYLIETEDANGVQNADAAATHEYIRALRRRMNERAPGAVLLGEAWTNAEDQAAYWGKGDELDLTFSFDMASSIVEVARDGVRGRLNQMLERSAAAFPDRGFEAPFLTNHDMPRVAREMPKEALRVAAALMLASPGTPFLYYGEEIGMVGGAERADENKRTPMHWSADAKGGFTTGEPWWPMTDEAAGVDVATQAADAGSLLNLYRKLVAARKASVVMRRGDEARVDQRGGKGVVSFVRSYEGARVLVVANVDKVAVPPFSIAIAGAPRVLVSEGLDQAPTSDGATLTLALGARGFAWITLE